MARAKEQLHDGGQGWAEDFSPGAFKLIGLAELLGAIGLILPPLTHIAPVLAPHRRDRAHGPADRCGDHPRTAPRVQDA